MYQLDLFHNSNSEYDILWNEINQTKTIANDAFTRADNTRKGIFKRHTELSKLYMQLLEKQEELERRLMMIEGIRK